MQNIFNAKSENKSVLLKKNILNYFVINGNATIQELAKVVALSVPTVTKAVGELLNMGYVNEYGKQETSEGRHPVLYGLNPDSGYFVGVEIKDGMVNIGLANFRGDLIDIDEEHPCRIDNTMESMEELCDVVKGFIERSGVNKEKLINVLFCIGGRVNSESGYSHTTYNFTEEPLTTVLSNILNYPVAIENDSRAVAYAEYMNGAVHGEKNVLVINASMGLGLGIIIDGKLYNGRSGFAGEIGHMHLFNNEILCHCGKKGCLETEASGRAIMRIVKERIAAGESSFLTQNGKTDFTINDVVDAVVNEDPLCLDVIEHIGIVLGETVANLINVFNPELVVVGGMLARTGDFLLQALTGSMRKYSLNLVSKDTRVALAKFNDRGCIIGACLLARKKVLE